MLHVVVAFIEKMLLCRCVEIDIFAPCCHVKIFYLVVG